MALPVTNSERVHGATSTTGTGSSFVVTAVAGFRSFATFANGTWISIDRNDGGNNFESGIVSVSTSGGVTTLTWVARLETSNGGRGGGAVDWTGTQDVVNAPIAADSPSVYNSLSEYAASGDTACGNLGAATDGVRSLSGGSDGRAVRYTSSATVTNAQNTDTAAQLGSLLFRSGGKYYRSGDVVPGLSGLTAGQNYWLGTNATPLLTTPPTPSASVRVVYIGQALTTGRLLFVSSQVITG